MMGHELVVLSANMSVILPLVVCMQDKHQLERIAVLEAQVANLTSTIAVLTYNIESANAKVSIRALNLVFLPLQPG